MYKIFSFNAQVDILLNYFDNSLELTDELYIYTQLRRRIHFKQNHYEFTFRCSFYFLKNYSVAYIIDKWTTKM